MARRRRDSYRGKIARSMFQAEVTENSKALGRNYKKVIVASEDCSR